MLHHPVGIVGFLACWSGALAAEVSVDPPPDPHRSEDQSHGIIELARERMLYVDHEDGRATAEIHASLLYDPLAGVRLHIAIASHGPLIEPVYGFRGVRGDNRITAEQLNHILSGELVFEVSTVTPSGPNSQIRTTTVSVFDRLRERRFRADGTIDHLARTVREYPTELIVKTEPLPGGIHMIQALFNGSAQFIVETRVEGGFAVIEELRVVAGDEPPVTVVELNGDAPLSDSPPRLADELVADWARRDLEGKWVACSRSLDVAPYLAPSWVAYLADQREFELLEMLAAYRVDGMASWRIGDVLAEAQAPQWIRCAWWGLHNKRGHGGSPAQALLLRTRPGVVLGWFERYPEAAAAAPGVNAWLKKNTTSEDPGNALPPRRAEDLLAAMQPTKPLQEFGDRLRAEPGVIYVHQVERAIQGMITGFLFDEPWLGRLRVLIEHQHPRIRRAAFLGYTSLPARQIPLDACRTALFDTREEPLVREAALLALSYSDYPGSYFTLHDIAIEPDHPAWRAAVSRLGDIGDPVTTSVLAEREQGSLDPEDLAVVTDTIERISEREAAYMQNMANSSRLYLILERIVWADETDHRLEGPLVVFLDHLAEQDGAGMIAALYEIAAHPPHSTNQPEGLTERVQALARTLADKLQEARAQDAGSPDP